MKVEGRHTFKAPREVVWKALLDPEVLSRTLPGCDRLEEIGENEFQGDLNVRVGPVEGRFSGTVRLHDLQAGESFRIELDGQGPQGFMKGEGRVTLEDDAGATVIRYDIDAQIGGGIASVGQRLLDSSARVIVRQAIDGLGRQLTGRIESREPGGASILVEAPTQAEFAAGFARGMMKEIFPPERRRSFMIAAVVLFVLAVVLTYAFAR